MYNITLRIQSHKFRLTPSPYVSYMQYI